MVKEMNGDLNKKPAVDSKVIEEWVNTMLREAEAMKDLPVNIATIEAKIATNRFGIDRMTLTNAGVPDKDVDRLY